MVQRTTARSIFVVWVWVCLCPGLSSALPGPLDIPIAAGIDDGEEFNDAIWVSDTPDLDLGTTAPTTVQDLGLRFLVPELTTCERVYFARLRFDAHGGAIIDSLAFDIVGALEVDSPPLTQDRRPSKLARTKASVRSTLHQPWLEDVGTANFYYSADLSAILNEIISQPGWPADSAAVILVVDASATGEVYPDYVRCRARESNRWPVTLQVCRTLEETFIASEILGRPTDVSATIDFMSLVSLEAFAEYGTTDLSESTPVMTVPAEQPGRIEIAGLPPNSLCRYRLCYRLAGSAEPFTIGPEHSFHTQRAPGTSFTFTTEADSHLWDLWQYPSASADVGALYATVLANVAADSPDFHFNLGDFSNTEYSRSWIQAIDRYLIERRFLGEVLHSIPFYLVLGNHEGEHGWRRSPPDSVVIWAERARRLLVPNPYPDRFYGGCPDTALSGPGHRESYYAWEWGDALFVVLDPYWYTMERPYHQLQDRYGTGWDWTLGYHQYEWLYHTLHDSDRRWKIVLLHHLTGGIEDSGGYYGRGGIEVAKWAVAHRPSFEWGGEGEHGYPWYPFLRPGWVHGPIHDLLAAAGVNLVIHGHDHACAIQRLDGITYALCPTPTDLQYTYGYMDYAGYERGIFLPNTGHLRFRVDSQDIVIEYVRAYLDGQGDNGEVALSYSVNLAGAVPAGAGNSGSGLRISPNPVVGGASVLFRLPFAEGAAAAGSLDIFDPSGRLCVTLRPQPEGTILWNGRDDRNRPVSSGVYYCVSRSPGETHARSIVVIR